MQTNYRPLFDRVIVKPMPASEKSAGGIIIPQIAQSQPDLGTVKAVGTDCKNVKAGDKVLYDKGAGMEIQIDGEDCLIMLEASIICVIDGVMPESERMNAAFTFER